MNDGAMVAWILIPVFVAIGLYLLWYSRRRKRLLESFANTNQLQMCPDRKDEIQADLDTIFALEDKDLVRSFSQISSVICGEGIWIFRAIELLDLNPNAQSYTTHFNRIIALFNISARYDAYFLIDPSGQHQLKLPGRNSSDPSIVVDVVGRIVQAYSVRHTLSVTLKRGHGLIYFQPSVVGGETIADINVLYRVAKQLRQELA